MGITQLNFELKTKVEVAIEALKLYEPLEGYYLADSGGKDSTAVRLLTKMSGVKFDAHYCVSPIDPPQIYKFLKEHHPDTQWDFYAKGFWKIVDKEGLPSRQARWCCRIIKEAGGNGRIVITGVRAEEGANRSHYPIYERNHKNTKTYLRPVLSWSVGEIWEFLKENNEPYCELYDAGFKRLGCILCPFSGDIKIQEYYFPKVTNLWLLACDRLIKARIARGQKTKTGKEIKLQFQTGQELYDWWTKRR